MLNILLSMKGHLGLFLTVILTTFPLIAHSQSIHDERIRPLAQEKESNFFSEGVFHSGNTGARDKSEFKALRHSFHAVKGVERLVFDWKSLEIPKLYGHMSAKENILYLDFSNAHLLSPPKAFGDGKFVKEVHFYQFSDGVVSVEIHFKGRVSVRVFPLKSKSSKTPARLVIDVKK